MTCLCPTYGRFEKLRLALACFLDQDYPGEKRLLVLNDSGVPIQVSEASFEMPECVDVINSTFAYPNLGLKRQALLEAAETPLVAHWDDDDLYLPWHLTRSVAALVARHAGPGLRSPEGGVGCVKSCGAWYMTGSPPALTVNGIHHNVFEGTMVFERDEALALCGYPPLHSGQAKALMDAFAKAKWLYAIPDDEGGGPSYVYRWADGVGHISGIGNRADTAARFKAQNRDFGVGQPLTPGDLTPYWAALGEACLGLPSDSSHPSHRTH